MIKIKQIKGLHDQIYTYVFEQSSPQTIWTIVHNLGKNPSISVVDSSGNVVEGSYQYIDVNTIQITFSAAFSGKCYLN